MLSGMCRNGLLLQTYVESSRRCSTSHLNPDSEDETGFKRILLDRNLPSMLHSRNRCHLGAARSRSLEFKTSARPGPAISLFAMSHVICGMAPISGCWMGGREKVPWDRFGNTGKWIGLA